MIRKQIESFFYVPEKVGNWRHLSYICGYLVYIIRIIGNAVVKMGDL